MSGYAKVYHVKKNNDTRYATDLEQYDFLPYFVIKNNNKKFTLHVESGQYLFFFVSYSLSPEEYNDANILWKALNVEGKFICLTYMDGDLGPNHYYDKCLSFKFGIKKKGHAKLFIVNKNLKIEKVYESLKHVSTTNFRKEYSLIQKKNDSIQSPVYIIQDVITEELRIKMLDYWKNNNHNTTNTDSKHRIDAHPDKRLELEIDNKLTKSLLPEMKKVYHIDITHRENYKICCYDGQHSGRFHPHRDTPHPYSHRRYALVIVLNDEFEGGGLRLKEYGKTIYKPPVRSAVIFPCMSYHEVVPIETGKRFVIISFLFSDDEVEAKAKHKVKTCVTDINRYKFKTERNQYNINLSWIYPLSK